MQNNEEEEKRTKFIRQVYQMVYEYKFEELLNLLNTNYPSFANKNQNIIYILLKFNFIKIILHQHDFSAAKKFYSNQLFLMMKKIYHDKSHSFYKKNFKYNCFLNQINSSLSKFINFQNHFKFENHLDKFMNLFEKSLEKKQRSEKNPVIFNITKAKTNQNNKDININEINSINNNNGKILFKTEHVNVLIYNNENMSEIEDELFKLNLEENKKNIFNVQNSTAENKNVIITENEIASNPNNYEEYNINSFSNISDISNSNTSSYNELNSNKIKIKKFEEKREISPINKSKQKFNLNNKIRRVNLCKKIVRKFKKYLKKNIKEITYSFWTSFCRENYLPPFKTEEIEFKSFSQLYLNWLFTHQGGIELYNQFILNSGEEELTKIYSNYNVQDLEDKITVKNFFINFAVFFANLKINEIRNNSSNIINNSTLNKDLVFPEPDFATNLFGNNNYNNYNYYDNYKIREEDEELSIGSINNDLYKEERINNDEEKEKECVRENNNRNINEENIDNKMILSSDSSNSSMENINTNNINIDNNIYKKYKNKCKYNRCNINPFSADNSNFYESSFINNINKKLDNKINEIYPDINMFEFDMEKNIKVSHQSLYFINKEENDIDDENKNEKSED